MRKKPSITYPVRWILVAATAGASIAIGLAWNVALNASAATEVARIRTQYVAEREAATRRLVELGAEYVAYRSSESARRTSAELTERVYQAHAIATTLHRMHQSSMPESSVKKVILESLRPLRFNEGRGYYFAVTLEGVELLYPVAPEFEGKNLLDLRDERGTYVIREEIRVARDHGEGFVRGMWKKPGSTDGKAWPKLSFVKRFDPYGWYLGAGEYLDETAAEARLDALEWISRLHTDDNRTWLYAATYDGEPLFSSGLLAEGVSDPRAAASSWARPAPELLRAIEADPTPRFFRGDVTGQTEEGAGVVAYAMGVPEWGWILAAQFDASAAEADIEERRGAIETQRLYATTLILVVALTGAALGTAYSFWFSRKVGATLDGFMGEFAGAASALEPLPTERRWSELESITRSANTIILDRKKANDELLASLHRQETLVREVHHRVKNNLAIISSLIRLRARRLDTDADRAALADIDQRVNAIAMIHAKLYGGDDVSSVDMRAYLPDLASSLSGMGTDGAMVSVRATSDQVRLPNDMAITLGLLVSELVVNSLKHAFLGRSGGSIEIRLERNGESLALSVRDDGIGFDGSGERPGSLGMSLIAALSEHLGGTGTFARDGGTRFSLSFPAPSGEKPPAG